jgi:hypothetical protein
VRAPGLTWIAHDPVAPPKGPVNSAIVLPRSALLDASPAPAVRRDDAATPTCTLTHGPPQYVYGDSTPFPYGVDFIATTRAAVSCAVALMRAQHAIDGARARVQEAHDHERRLDADLRSVAGAIDGALASRGPQPPQVRDVANRIAALARDAIEGELRRARTVLDATLRRAEETMAEARKSAASALAQLLRRHEMPGGSLGFRLFARDGGYAADVTVQLPGGMRATFEATLPEGHAWRTPKRVRDVRPGTTITLPRRVGWLHERVEPRPVRLDGQAVLGASLEGARGVLLLGKNERAGVAHAFDVDFALPRPRVQWRDGEETSLVELGRQDAALVAKLLRAVESATRELLSRRGAMTEATLDGKPLAEHDPGEVCARLVGLVAPTVREIARRSGAPGELVLRRNVDAGHRDEVFVTTAELQEPIDTLPPSLRLVFAPLELHGAPRSPRAPARSLPTYEEISACEILPAS